MKKIILLSCLVATPVISTEINLVENINTLRMQQNQSFEQKTHALANSINAFCVAGDFAKQQQNVEQNWVNTMQAWMPLQGVTKGPISEFDLAWSFQFWPDKKDITGRKIKQLLQSQTTDWDAQKITEQSVAVRGLGALELLIFEQKLTAENCSLATAIANNLENNSQRVSHAWSEQYAPQLLAQSKDQAQRKELEKYIVAELSHQLSYINKKFDAPWADAQPRPYQAEAWRSENSMLLLKSSYLALQQYFLEGVKPQLINEKQTDLLESIERTFETLLTNWPTEASLKKLLSDKSGLRQVFLSKMSMDALTYQLQEEVPVALNIVVGFNATDGD